MKIEEMFPPFSLSTMEQQLDRIEESLNRLLKQNGGLIFCDECPYVARSCAEIAQHFINEHQPK